MLSNKTLTAAQFQKQHCPTEYEECLALVKYLKAKGLFFFHIPNEDASLYRKDDKHSQNIRLKAARIGKKSGVPDYYIRLNDKAGSTIWIEMKRRYGSKITKAQQDFQDEANQQPNTYAMISRGADQAIKLIEAVLKMDKSEE